jgi:CTP:molybdopterin cytidylyltransferase MocA
MTTAAAVLAAGGGSRFDGAAHKLLTPFRGKPLVCWAIEAACAAGADDVVVVAGAVDLAGALPEGVAVVVNDRWGDGLATSLQAAVRWADAGGHDAVVVGLGDQPLIPAAAWRAVVSATSPIAVATYGGERRNPVRLHRSVWGLLPTEGDEGARAVFARAARLVGEVACDGEPADVDTVEDLGRWS